MLALAAVVEGVRMHGGSHQGREASIDAVSDVSEVTASYDAPSAAEPMTIELAEESDGALVAAQVTTGWTDYRGVCTGKDRNFNNPYCVMIFKNVGGSTDKCPNNEDIVDFLDQSDDLNYIDGNKTNLNHVFVPRNCELHG